MRFIKNEKDLHHAVDALCQMCDIMKKVHDECGYPPLRLREDGFEGIVDIIVAQQLSVASARAIFARLDTLMAHNWQVHNFAQKNDEELRACGLSRPKIKTLRNLQTACLKGELDFASLYALSETQVIDKLTHIKGIGPWTAQIYLSFCMGHIDQFPAGDLALQIAIEKLHSLSKKPSEKECALIAERWQPYRSVAAFLLWLYYRQKIKISSGMPL